MKKRKIQVAVVLFIAAVTLLFSSFGRQVDIEERVLCHAMGVDYENGEYNVSLQVFKTQSMGSDTPLDVSQSNIRLSIAKAGVSEMPLRAVSIR